MLTRLIKLIFSIYLFVMILYFWSRAIHLMFESIFDVIGSYLFTFLVFAPIGLYIIKLIEIHEKRKNRKKKRRL